MHTPDTDVFILMVYFSTEIAGLCLKTCRGNKRRIIDVDTVKNQLAADLNEDINIDNFCQALVGLHAFTCCDSVSSLAVVGKTKPFNQLSTHAHFVENFQNSLKRIENI